METSISLRLSAQRALLGCVTPNLVAVTVDLEGTQVRLRAYFDGEIGDDEWDVTWEIGEMIADFPDDYTIREECLVWTGKKDVPGFWVFLRRENLGEA